MSVLVPSCSGTMTQVGNVIECDVPWSLVEVPDYVEFQQLEDAGSTFTLADLDSTTMGEAWAAGFILMGTAWATAVGARWLLHFIRTG